jgi:hypothetical protein
MGDPIFLYYDGTALDREYDNRAKVASSADVLAWYARESVAARGALACRLDVAYGPRPGETLDVFLPASGRWRRSRSSFTVGLDDSAAELSRAIQRQMGLGPRPEGEA